jgi:hypothetical protein
MTQRQRHVPTHRFVASTTLVLFLLSGGLGAQAPAPPAASPPAGTAPAVPAATGATGQEPAEKSFSQAELDQLLAPIALYPDSLLAQVLMASTYPIEIVMADRWVKANPNLRDKALEDALQKQTWDASVKSLAVLPQVLAMMSEKLDWTQKLGDAFLAQPKEVMATAQALRSKAVAQGALQDTKEQKVVKETVEQTTVIKIEPTNPEVVYVPTYNPTVVYGYWPYPAYPPYYWYPPGYVAGGALLGFTAGVIVGGALWGNCNWGHGDVNVDVNRYNNFNRTNISNGNWQHNAEHRGAVPYRDKAVAQQYNRGASPNAATRDAYRGRADAGQPRAAQTATRPGGDAASRNLAGTGSAGSLDRAGTMDRGGGAAANRDFSGGRSPSAFDTGSHAQTRDYSSRGASSMGASHGSGMSGGSYGGGARGGGGAPRGGGGGRGGRR